LISFEENTLSLYVIGLPRDVCYHSDLILGQAVHLSVSSSIMLSDIMIAAAIHLDRHWIVIIVYLAEGLREIELRTNLNLTRPRRNA